MNGMPPIEAGMAMLEPLSIFLSLALLVVFFIMLIIMATFLFYHGQRYMIEPTHSIQMALDAFKALQQRQNELLRKRKREKGDDAGASKEEDDIVRLPSEDARAAGGEDPESIKAFPIHDAPLWIISFILTTILYIFFLAVDLSGSSFYQDPNWLENVILGNVPIVRYMVPFKSTAVALIFYLFVEFGFMLITAHVLYRALQIRHLNLVGKEDPVRKRVEWLWRTCGFIDYRKLDRSCRLWLIRPVMGLAPFLVAVDMLTYFQRLSVWTGGLALSHLFFIALVRVFDETWLYPVNYEYSSKQTPSKTTLRQLAENIFKSGAVDQVPVFLMEIPGEKDRRELKGLPDVNLPPLAVDFLESMSGKKKLWGHQAAGWTKVFEEHESVILCGPQGSGKRTWARLTALNEVIYRSGGVLRILPDRESLAEEVVFMNTAIARSGARWNITVFDASSPEFMAIDIAKHPTFLVLADPLSIDQVLLSHWDHFGNFWSTLSRIIVEGISDLTGLQASHFYYLFRRLVVTRALDNSRPVAICGTCERMTKRMENEIEHLMGVHLSFVIADEARSLPVLLYGIPNGPELKETPDAQQSGSKDRVLDSRLRFERPASMAIRIGAEIRRQGYSVYYGTGMVSRHEMEREHVLGSWAPVTESNPDPVKAAVSILFVNHENLFSLADDIRHFGAFSGEQEHVCFLLFSHDAAVQYYILHPEKLFSDFQMRIHGNFIFNPDNRSLIERHIESALGKMPLSQDQLEYIFGRMTLAQLLPDMQKEERISEIDNPEHEFTGCYTLKKKRSPGMDLDALASEALEIVRPGQGRGLPVLKGEEELIRSRFYPGRIFLWNGNRYQVSLTGKNLACSGPLQVGACEDDLVTSKMRTVSMKLEAASFGEKSSLCTVSGGKPFRFGTVPVSGTETISGFRILGDDLKPISTTTYADLEGGQEMKLEWKSEVLLLAFPGTDVDERVLELVACLWSEILAAFFGGEFDEPDVFLTPPLPVGDGALKPCLCVREFYPDGGIGVIRAQDPTEILRCLNLARSMLVEVPDIEALLNAHSNTPRIDAELKNKAVEFINLIIPPGQPASDDIPCRELERKGAIAGTDISGNRQPELPESCREVLDQSAAMMEKYRGRLKKGVRMKEQEHGQAER